MIELDNRFYFEIVGFEDYIFVPEDQLERPEREQFDLNQENEED